MLKINGCQYKDNIKNFRILAHHKLLDKGPATRRYPFPSRYPEPLPIQISTVDYMCRYRRGHVHNGIGTGKTLCIDWTIDFLKKEGEIDRALIVAPLSTLDSVHAEELMWSMPWLSFTILHGSKEKRIKELRKDRDVYIVNFEGLKILEQELHNRPAINAVFIDEVSKYRNRHNLWAVTNRLYGPQNDKVVFWGLTGSPMPNGPTDCYAQALLIEPDSLPQMKDWRASNKTKPITFGRFRALTMTQVNEFKWLPKQNWLTHCHSALRPSIRFTRDDIGSHPPRMTETRQVVMCGDQKTYYNQMLNTLSAEIKGKQVTAANAGAHLLKLLQISSGAVYDEKRGVHATSYAGKLKVLKEVIREAHPSHIIVFTPFRNILDFLSLELNKSYGKGTAEVVKGGMSRTVKSDIFHRFNHGTTRFLVAIPESMSHGLNLQNKCNCIVWWSPILKPEAYEQGNGRADRHGQTKEVLIVHLESSEVEKKLYKKLKTKETNQQILLEILGGK